LLTDARKSTVVFIIYTIIIAKSDHSILLFDDPDVGEGGLAERNFEEMRGKSRIFALKLQHDLHLSHDDKSERRVFFADMCSQRP
jgi:hypothetical protein